MIDVTKNFEMSNNKLLIEKFILNKANLGRSILLIAVPEAILLQIIHTSHLNNNENNNYTKKVIFS